MFMTGKTRRKLWNSFDKFQEILISTECLIKDLLFLEGVLNVGPFGKSTAMKSWDYASLF